MPPPAGRKGQRADDAAAHAGAMRTARESEQQGRDPDRRIHELQITFE
jgi:hypothetical protein